MLNKVICMVSFFIVLLYTAAAVFCFSGQQYLKKQLCGVSLTFEWFIINCLTIFLLIEITLSYLSFTVCCLATEWEKRNVTPLFSFFFCYFSCLDLIKRSFFQGNEDNAFSNEDMVQGKATVKAEMSLCKPADKYGVTESTLEWACHGK